MLTCLCSCADAAPSEQEELFIQQLKACETIYDFNDVGNAAGKEAKRRTLADMADYAGSRKGAFTPRVVGPLMAMVAANIERPLTPPGGSATAAAAAAALAGDAPYDADDDEPALEPAWSHLELVYELLRRFVASADAERPAARALLTPRFVRTLVDLFQSEDPRERDALKTILHRVYGKTMPLRAPARAAIMDAFLRVVHERAHHPGLPELLEVLGAIVNGFSVPLKPEHVALLRRALLPLHAARAAARFHTQLAFVVAQFVHKQPALAPEVARELVRHWPGACSRTEVLFLNELEEVLELARPADAAGVVAPLFKRIASSTRSLHFQVAERALYFWNNASIVALFVHYRDRLMPIVVGPLHDNVSSHWNPNVQSLSFHVQNLLRDLDAELYADSLRRYHVREERVEIETTERMKRWRALDSIAERRRRSRASSSMPNLSVLLHTMPASEEHRMDAASFSTSVILDVESIEDFRERREAAAADRCGAERDRPPEGEKRTECRSQTVRPDSDEDEGKCMIFGRCSDSNVSVDDAIRDAMRAGRRAGASAAQDAPVSVDLSV